MYKSIPLLFTVFSLFFKGFTQQSPSCVISKYSTYIELKSNKLIEVDSIKLQINNRSGETYADVKIPFNANKKMSELKVWLEDKAGTLIRVLDKNEIGERSLVVGSVLYQEDLLKTFQVKHNVYPYSLCYTYKYTISDYFDIAAWSPCINAAIPTTDAKLYVSFPKHISHQKYIRGVLLNEIDSSGLSCKYAFQGKYESHNGSELFAESITNTVPVVFIALTKFKYGIDGSQETWRALGDWVYQLNKSCNDLPPSERELAKQLTKGITEPREKVKILYHYMQDHTRYINVFMGIGGLKSYAASYVAKNKYGDCKALSYYMQDLLKSVGIKSNVVLLYGDQQPNELDLAFVHSQFNHMLLAVPLDEDTIWIENTSNTHPFGYVGTFIQNREALWVEENRSYIVRIPSLNTRSVTNYKKMSVILSETAEAVFDTEFHIRGTSKPLSETSTKDEWSSFVSQSLGLDKIGMQTWNLPKIHRDTTKFQAIVTFNAGNFVKKTQDDLYFNVLPLVRLSFENPSDRNTRVHLPYPIYDVDSVEYILPETHEIKSIPDHNKISSKFGSYTFEIRRERSVIYTVKTLELYPQLISLESYKEFYQFYQSIKDAERKALFVLKKK